MIYLDYNATAPLLPEVKTALQHALELTGNASSVHSFGRQVRKFLEQARGHVAHLVNCEPTHVTFTSGATEANNMAIGGFPAERILFSAIEHPSVLEAASRHLQHKITPVTKEGIVDLDQLDNQLSQSKDKTLVCVMWVNNETGVIQPVSDIAALCQQHDAWLHVDAVQAAGRLKIDLQTLPIHSLSLSAHKMGGPSGIGALIYNHDVPLQKFLHGGGQERRRRAGTENTLGIIGFGAAAQIAAGSIDSYQALGQWRNNLEKRLQQAVPETLIVGQHTSRIGNTTQLILPTISAEKQLLGLDLAGIAVSSGSACSSGSIRPSHVLLAMGYNEELAKCALRISMGLATTQLEIDRFVEIWVANAQRLLGK